MRFYHGLLRLLRTPIPLPLLTRRLAHFLFALAVWPLITIAGATATILDLPIYRISPREAFLAALAGTVIRVPDILLAGAVVFGVSWWIFSRLGAEPRGGRLGAFRLAVEPCLMFTTMIGCVALWYPAILSQPLLVALASLPVAAALLILAGLCVLGVWLTGRPGSRGRLTVVLLAAGLLSPVPLWGRAWLEGFGGSPPSLILLGVDSLSHSDDLGPLTNWVRTERGTWYERAVSPGLFTNAVWTSILTMRPVREHGVFHTFQRFTEFPAPLIRAAHGQGYRTVAMFSDQLTSTVGSRAGFDEDRSSSIGWRQLLLPIIANSSFLVPVVRPALPRAWPGAPAANEAGTFTYHLRREIRSILRAGSRETRTLVAAHLTYTHLPAYPASVELTWGEIAAILRAPAGLITDRTMDWQHADRAEDPLALRSWKVQHLQRALDAEVTAARYLAGGGRLIVFSDHGSRTAMNVDSFTDARYYHVVLATFGLPPACPHEPVSLIDIGALAGLARGWARPTVEFTIAPYHRFPALVQTARLRWAGDVDLDPTILAEVFAGLQRHDPWGELLSTAGRADTRCRRLSP